MMLMMILQLTILLIEFKETVMKNISSQEQKAETFMINQLVIKSESMMKLERLQQETEIITQQDVC